MDQMTIAKTSNKQKTKKITEEDILLSLDKAIKSYSEKDFTTTGLETTLNQDVQNKDLDVAEIYEESIKAPSRSASKTKVLKSNPAKKSVQKSTVKEAKKSKNSLSSKKMGLFKKVFGNKSKAKKVEKPVVVTKTISKSGSKRFSKVVSQFYSKYQKQLATSALALTMLSFAGFSGFIAYAYVASSNSDIIAKVSDLAILPTNETPKVYIIQSEKSEIFQNPLFKGIQVGDNVLSYTNANKVIIYRSAEDKIVNIVSTTQ